MFRKSKDENTKNSSPVQFLLVLGLNFSACKEVLKMWKKKLPRNPRAAIVSGVKKFGAELRGEEESAWVLDRIVSIVSLVIGSYYCIFFEV